MTTQPQPSAGGFQPESIQQRRPSRRQSSKNQRRNNNDAPDNKPFSGPTPRLHEKSLRMQEIKTLQAQLSNMIPDQQTTTDDDNIDIGLSIEEAIQDAVSRRNSLPSRRSSNESVNSSYSPIPPLPDFLKVYDLPSNEFDSMTMTNKSAAATNNNMNRPKFIPYHPTATSDSADPTRQTSASSATASSAAATNNNMNRPKFIPYHPASSRDVPSDSADTRQTSASSATASLTASITSVQSSSLPDNNTPTLPNNSSDDYEAFLAFIGQEDELTKYKASSSPANDNIDASARSWSHKLKSSLSYRKTKKTRLPTYSFLEKDRKDSSKEDRVSIPKTSWWQGVFFFSIISFIACVVTLWAPYPIGARMTSEQVAATGITDGCQDGLDTCICPRATICADNMISMVFLTISRCLAWFDYPLYMLLFMSKCHNLNHFLQNNTMLRIFVNFSDYHHVHRIFGIWVGIESFVHSFFHILRWALRNDDIQYLWNSQTGVTGLVTLCCTPLVILPMTVPYLKSKMSFEWRKGLHYLSWIWVLSLMFHAPQRIFWMLGVPFFVYLTDMMIGALSKTHLLESAYFERLSDSFCLITFENPPGFGKSNAAYLYLVLPWVSKVQFHAFTVFPSLDTPNHSSICIHGCGDWTKALMNEVSTPAHKPAYVMGPYLSPFSSPAMDCENLIAVASGIGVTPCISLVKKYSQETLRRVNLIWICRDPGLVEHFLSNISSFGQYGFTLIYYTGKGREIVLDEDLPPNVFLFKGRPNLHQTLSGIIYSIISGDGLPEELCAEHKLVSKVSPDMRAKLLIEKALSIYSHSQLFHYAIEASYAYNYLVNGDEEEGRILHQSIVNTNLRSSITNANHFGLRRSTIQAPHGGMSQQEFINSLLKKSSREGKAREGKGNDDNFIYSKSYSKKDSRGSNNSSIRRRRTTQARRPTLSNDESFRGRLKRGFSSKASLESVESEDIPEEERANLEGVQTIMKQILGDDYIFVEDSIPKNFGIHAINGELLQEGFVRLMDSIVDDDGGATRESISTVKRGLEKRKSVADLMDASKRVDVSSTDEDEFQIKEVLQGKGDNKYSAKYWSLLYCGGSQPVVDQLKKYKKEFGIGLSIEKFDW